MIFRRCVWLTNHGEQKNSALYKKFTHSERDPNNSFVYLRAGLRRPSGLRNSPNKSSGCPSDDIVAAMILMKRLMISTMIATQPFRIVQFPVLAKTAGIHLEAFQTF